MHLKRLAFVMVGVLSAAAVVSAEDGAYTACEPYVGEVMVETLNVRSGPSTNYYVVTRLRAGGLLKIVGEESGWLAIVPPAGCFSLIAAEYVDIGDGVNGVVNGSRVRVRAGSDAPLPDPYAEQLKLDRGALVKIVGKYDDKYLKIAPPSGAVLWVASDFVTKMPGAALNSGLAVAEPPIQALAGAPGRVLSAYANDDVPPGYDSEMELVSSGDPIDGPESAGDGAVASADPAPAETTLAGPPEKAAEETMVRTAADYREELVAADEILKEENAKPLTRRDFSSLLPRYQELAAQEVDDYVRAYAEVRIQQLETARDLIGGWRTVEELREDVRATRKNARAGRADIKPVPVRVGGGFDAEGELRVSMLYDSPVGPRRYRMVDPSMSPPRTVGYVEIPADSDIDVGKYLGRHVGVRARERVLQTGDVNPISIYVAAELVVLDRVADQTPPPAHTDDETKTASKP